MGAAGSKTTGDGLANTVSRQPISKNKRRGRDGAASGTGFAETARWMSLRNRIRAKAAAVLEIAQPARQDDDCAGWDAGSSACLRKRLNEIGDDAMDGFIRESVQLLDGVALEYLVAHRFWCLVLKRLVLVNVADDHAKRVGQ